MWGIQSAKTLSELAILCSKAVKRLYDMVVANTQKIEDHQSQIDHINTEINGIETDVTNLNTKQDREKSVKCIATQRTYNNTPTYGEFAAGDDSTAIASTNNRRRLNHFSTNEANYFELVDSGLATNYVRIKKPGKYIIRFTSQMQRTGNSTYCYLHVHEPSTSQTYRFDRPANITLATGATSVGNAMTGGGSIEIEFSSGTREVTLWHYFATRTAGYNYGRFGIHGNTSTDTCSIEVELIEDV